MTRIHPHRRRTVAGGSTSYVEQILTRLDEVSAGGPVRGVDRVPDGVVMDAQAVDPSTTAVLPGLGDSSALAFTVEPGNGSPQPTTPIIAELQLV